MAPRTGTRGLSKTFKEIKCTQEIVVHGGWSNSSHTVQSIFHDGARFAKIVQYDDWVIGIVTGKNRKDEAATLKDNDSWMIAAKAAMPKDLVDDPFAAIVEGAHAQAATRTTRKRAKTPGESGEVTIVIVKFQGGSQVQLLSNHSKSNKELWVREADIPIFLSKLADSHCVAAGNQLLTQQLLGVPQWMNGHQWVIHWMDATGRLQQESIKVALKSNRKASVGVKLSPQTFVASKMRARCRLKALARGKGATVSESEEDEDCVVNGEAGGL
jgi:hypothetical protein